MKKTTDIERSILEACLCREWQVINYIIGSVALYDFNEPEYREIYSAILDIAISEDLPTIFRIGEQLRSTGKDNCLDRLHALNGTSDKFWSIPGIKSECAELKDTAIRYKLSRIGNHISSSAEQDNGTATNELVNELYNKMLEMLTADQSGGAMDLREAIERTQKMQDERTATNSYARLKTGFSKLDEMLVIGPGKVIVVGGYTSHGKSALALCIANNMMLEGIPVLYITIEMDYSDIVYRLAAMNGQFNLSSLVRGHAPKIRQIDGIKAIAPHIDNFHLVDLDAASEVEVVLHMQQHMIRHPDTGLIVIDYIQNVDCERYPRLSRHLQVSTIARYFRSAAKRLKVPTMVVSQLARPEKRDGKFRMATIFDLKESGDIETSADAIILINRLDLESQDWYAIIDLAKQRMGQRGRVDMYFTGRHVRFEEQAIPNVELEEHKIKRM